MKKGFIAFTSLALLGLSSASQAKQDVCVFDLLGKAGESYKMMEEWVSPDFASFSLFCFVFVFCVFGPSWPSWAIARGPLWALLALLGHYKAFPWGCGGRLFRYWASAMPPRFNTEIAVSNLLDTNHRNQSYVYKK